MAEAIPTISIINRNSKYQTRIGISALMKLFSAKAQKTASNLLMIDRFGHAETGILADINLVKHLFRTLAGEQQRSKDGGERNRVGWR